MLSAISWASNSSLQPQQQSSPQASLLPTTTFPERLSPLEKCDHNWKPETEEVQREALKWSNDSPALMEAGDRNHLLRVGFTQCQQTDKRRPSAWFYRR